MLDREEWLELTRKLDWDFSYVTEEEAFPPEVSGTPWLPHRAWADWDEPFRTLYPEYVANQRDKDTAVFAVRDALGRRGGMDDLDPAWIGGVKLHAATLPLAEFAAAVGNLRAARFGRDSAWRHTALYGALDECRHTQIPLLLMHELVRWDPQFDYTHRFYHSKSWVAIAARHFFDELLLLADPIEMAVATNFVFETGFTNLQFIGLSAMANEVGDRLFQQMVGSIQTDEARHAQIGPATLATLVEHDREYAQRLIDKWFWRSWRLFSVVTGFSMDYLTPVKERRASFREFVEEWIIDQFLGSLDELGLQRPWYWDTFVDSLDHYHHMAYASAYTYRATVWFNMAVPGPEERAWLRRKYPSSWPQYDPIWRTVATRWRQSGPRAEFGVHGAAIVSFCNLCQLVLCGGTPQRNSAEVIEHEGHKHIFCSEPCRRLFEQEPERYAGHRDLVKRVLSGEAPPNLIELLTKYCGLREEIWGKDAFHGDYPWLHEEVD